MLRCAHEKKVGTNPGAGEAPVHLCTCRDRAKCSWHGGCERVEEKGVAWDSAGKLGWRNVTQCGRERDKEKTILDHTEGEKRIGERTK